MSPKRLLSGICIVKLISGFRFISLEANRWLELKKQILKHFNCSTYLIAVLVQVLVLVLKHFIGAEICDQMNIKMWEAFLFPAKSDVHSLCFVYLQSVEKFVRIFHVFVCVCVCMCVCVFVSIL